jgi:hypothetical protein
MLSQACHFLARVKTQYFREIQKFDNINSPLTTLQPGDERLILAQPLGKFRLGHASSFSFCNQQFD